jgi:general secretion pathway protein D
MSNPLPQQVRAILTVSVCVLLGIASGVAQEPPEAPQSLPSALATSQPFALEPRVERASLDLRQPTLRGLYDAIAEVYGVGLLYDRDLGQLPVSSNFRLQDATFQEALDAAGSISRTFVAPIDSRTGIVSADTAEKRGQYERVILGSFHMDDQITPQQLTEISVALRNLVDLRRVTQDSRSNWITVRGRTRQVAVAGQFLQTLQKAPGEVMLEVDVWEVNSRRARELGILPPQPFQFLFLGESGGGRSLSSLGRWSSFYGLRLPGLTALLQSSSSLVRSHQVVQLRASDSQQARFLAGQRVPVVSTIVSSAIEADSSQQSSSSGFIPGIEYQDVGVVVEATPYLHADRGLTLQLDLALRSLGPLAENGLPTFSNRQFTGQIRLSDGEGFLLGGLLTNTNRNSVTGYPWLSRIPLLGWLFANRAKQQDETEVLVMIRPRTLRLAPAEEFASRAIYFGRELTGLPAAAEPSPPGEVPVPQPPPGVPPQPGVFPPGVPVPGVFPPGVVPPGAQQFPVPSEVPSQPQQPPQPQQPFNPFVPQQQLPQELPQEPPTQEPDQL